MTHSWQNISCEVRLDHHRLCYQCPIIIHRKEGKTGEGERERELEREGREKRREKEEREKEGEGREREKEGGRDTGKRWME